MFAAVLLDKESKPYYINLKLEPLEGDFWRTQYEDIVPRILLKQTALEFN